MSQIVEASFLSVASWMSSSNLLHTSISPLLKAVKIRHTFRPRAHENQEKKNSRHASLHIAKNKTENLHSGDDSPQVLY